MFYGEMHVTHRFQEFGRADNNVPRRIVPAGSLDVAASPIVHLFFFWTSFLAGLRTAFEAKYWRVR
jgi:hypothetical protein